MDINLLRRLARLAPEYNNGLYDDTQQPEEVPNRAGILALAGGDINNVANQAPQSPLAQLAPQAGMPDTNYPTPILDQYGAFLKQAPDIANFKPSRGRRIMAGLATLDDRVRDPQATAENINYAPYNRQMGDYYTKAKLLGEGANVEEKQISNKRQIAYNEARMDLQNKLAEIKAEHEQLLRDKSSQINEVAWAKLQQQYDALAQRANSDAAKLEATKTNNAEANRLRELAIDAQNQRYQLGLERRDKEIEIHRQNADINAQRADSYAERLRQLGEPVETSEELLNPKGESLGRKITIRSRGKVNQAAPSSYVNPNAPKVIMTGPDGQDYHIPQDKVAETLKIPGWSIKR